MTDISYEGMRPIRAEPEPTGPLLPVPTGRDVIWTLLAGLVLMLVGAAGGAFLGFTFGGPGLGALLAALLAGTLGGAGLYVVLMRRSRWTLSDLGFRRSHRNLAHLLWQMPVMILAAAIAATIVAGLLGITPDNTEQMITEQTLELGPAGLIAMFVLIAGVVPLIEEIVFRRVLLDWLMAKMPMIVAAVVVSVLFALAHVAPAAIVYILFLGSALTFLRIWYRTLWAPLILHMTNNAMVSLVALAAVLA